MKQQVVAIHGGGSYNDRKAYLKSLKVYPVSIGTFNPRVDWKTNLSKSLGKNFEVLLPRMPNSNSARYEEWKIWFKRMVPFLKKGVILLGHSLGGIFLAKYLSENKFPKKIKAVILVAAPYNTKKRHPTADFNLNEKLPKFISQSKRLIIIHSLDDKVVDYKEALEYKDVLPDAELITFKNRGHFNQSEFPEIVELIKSLK